MINAWATRTMPAASDLTGPTVSVEELLAASEPTDPAVSVEELLSAHAPECGLPGPSHSRCMRADQHQPPCAALGTDTEGVPIVVCWWPAGRFPTPDRPNLGEPGA